MTKLDELYLDGFFIKHKPSNFVLTYRKEKLILELQILEFLVKLIVFYWTKKKNE